MKKPDPDALGANGPAVGDKEFQQMVLYMNNEEPRKPGCRKSELHEPERQPRDKDQAPSPGESEATLRAEEWGKPGATPMHNLEESSHDDMTVNQEQLSQQSEGSPE